MPRTRAYSGVVRTPDAMSLSTRSSAGNRERTKLFTTHHNASLASRSASRSNKQLLNLFGAEWRSATFFWPRPIRVLLRLSLVRISAKLRRPAISRNDQRLDRAGT